ncbi:hypothetical protein KC351_g125 [Hortaea werneckii]|nr:hypothetical protein KC351_g125 [Hortaea werneckii]
MLRPSQNHTKISIHCIGGPESALAAFRRYVVRTGFVTSFARERQRCTMLASLSAFEAALLSGSTNHSHVTLATSPAKTIVSALSGKRRWQKCRSSSQR